MKKELLFDERNNSRVWEIETLEDLNSLVYSIGDDDTCYYKNYTFTLVYRNNQIKLADNVDAYDEHGKFIGNFNLYAINNITSIQDLKEFL